MRKSRKVPASWARLFVLLVFLFSSGLIWAQEENADEGEDQTTDITNIEEEEETAELGNIVVTGSRLQRATYSSIAPLQIITAEGSREAGLIDAASILQNSTAATGQQIDLTFQGFVLDNGPGASTLSLRGLGSARTLVMLNGRRLAPAGVEGAPIAADLNLVPSSLVRQYDLLLDGASSIYGSDAVAGVTNIILRNDFDGFEVEADYQYPEHGAGTTTNLSLVWGENFDRGFIGVGIDYEDRDSVALADTDWTDECERHREIDENGNIRFQEQFWTSQRNMLWDDCRLVGTVGRVNVPLANTLFYTPGAGNGGWPNFSDFLDFGFSPDTNGDGIADVSLRDFDLNGHPESQAAQLFAEQERVNIMGYGEYVFEGEMNNTFFFELMYNERETFQRSGVSQFFPVVPASNPFNICNPNGLNGIDCGLAQDELYSNPNFIRQFANTFFESNCAPAGLSFEECTPAALGQLNGEIGAQEVQPTVAVSGDRNMTATNIKQYRAVAGLRGDLPFIDFGPFGGWQYETAFSYTESEGSSSRSGIRADRINYSLATTRIDENGNVVCGNGNDGCVPINMFAPSLYEGLVGDFATQAERDYVFDTRDFDTTYKQTIFSGFAGGFIGSLPGGPITAGVGFEYRIDDINSIPDEVARDGLFFGFFADGGAVGDKFTRELFAEIELPILAGISGVEELTANLSGRLTDDEFYGTAYTYSAKVGWRPVRSLLVRGTVGTSFRAPNVRELFLRDQTGFLNLTDPCVVPDGAIDELTGEYLPEFDDREQQVLQNCFNQGVDPTALDNGGIQVYSVETATGGSLDLDEETSTSFTYGFSFEQPWSDRFNFTVGASYYDIEIENSIIEPSAQFLINDCFNDEQFDSVFCDRIFRDDEGLLDIIQAGFINRDSEEVRGLDINLNFDTDFIIADYPVNFAIDAVINHTIEVSQTFIGDDGSIDFDDDTGEFGFAEWQGQADFRLETGNWRLTWRTRYIGDVEQDPDAVDDFDSIFGGSDTCFGPPDDVLCRDVGFADDYFNHTVSLFYYGDNWVFGAGVRNVFDESPPLVDGSEILSFNNVPIGFGYDLLGRTFFLNLAWRQ